MLLYVWLYNTSLYRFSCGNNSINIYGTPFTFTKQTQSTLHQNTTTTTSTNIKKIMDQKDSYYKLCDAIFLPIDTAPNWRLGYY